MSCVEWDAFDSGKRPSRKIPAGEPFSEDDETGGR